MDSCENINKLKGKKFGKMMACGNIEECEWDVETNKCKKAKQDKEDKEDKEGKEDKEDREVKEDKEDKEGKEDKEDIPCASIKKKRKEKHSEVKQRCKELPGCTWNNKSNKCIVVPSPPDISKPLEDVALPRTPKIKMDSFSLVKATCPAILVDLAKEGFKPFTFNNIIKYYGPKVILDQTGSVSNYQWHRFQLIKIAELYSLPTRDPVTKNSLSRTKLVEQIVKASQVNDIKVEASQELIKLGLVPQKTPDIFINNIGGQPSQPLVLNKYKTDVLFGKENSYRYLSPLEASQGSPVSQVDASKSSSISQVSQTSSSSQVSLGEPTCMRGSIKWHANKCYMDTILQLLLVDTPENSLRPLILGHLERRLQALDPESKEARLSKQIESLANKLERGENTNSRVIVNQIRNFVKNTHDYVNNKTADTNEFLMFFLEIIGIDTSSYNIKSHTYAKNKLVPEVNISTVANKLSELPAINSNYTGVFEKEGHEVRSSAISLLAPAISLVSLPIPNNSRINELLAWQEVSGPFGAPPYYQISTGEQWVYGNGKFSQKDEVLELYPNKNPALTLKEDTQEIIYRDQTIARYGYRYKIDRFSINDANILIIPLNRQIFDGPQDTIKKTTIIPDQVINCGDGQLGLFSIISYGDGGVGHYFGYYLCNDMWYNYDDNATNSIKSVGDYDTLLRQEGMWVKDRSCILFYRRLGS